MSGVKRYGIHFAVKHMIKEDDDGEYVLASDCDQLHAANQRLEGEVKRLREAGSALSNIAYNLAQRPGVTLDVIVCDTLSSARKSWDAALSTANDEEGATP